MDRPVTGMAMPVAAQSATVSSTRVPAAARAAPIRRAPAPVKVPGTNWKHHRVDPRKSRTVATAPNAGANWTIAIRAGSIPSAPWAVWHAAEARNVMATNVVTGSQILEGRERTWPRSSVWCWRKVIQGLRGARPSAADDRRPLEVNRRVLR